MAKRLPDSHMRRDSMNTHFSGDSTKGTPSPLLPQQPTVLQSNHYQPVMVAQPQIASMQSHHYQPPMVPQAPTSYMPSQASPRYTQEQIQQLVYHHDYKAFMRNQAQLNAATSQDRQRIQEYRLAVQNGYLPGAPTLAQQRAYQNVQHAGYQAQPPQPYQEGHPVPNVGLFTTAPPSRPNSAQGMAAPLQQKKPSQTGTVQLGRPRKEPTAPNKSGIGAKISTGAPFGPAAATSQIHKPQVVDLTGESKPQQQREQQPSITQPTLTPQAPKPAATKLAAARPTRISKRALPTKRDLHCLAQIHGVHMSLVEHGTNIQATLEARLLHASDLAAARSLLDPHPTTCSVSAMQTPT